MSIIYEPKGKAREYSPLAANFYTGCDHGCKYCYAPGIRRMTREDYEKVTPRRNVLSEFKKDCIKLRNCNRQVLFNFMGDPYCKKNDESKITRNALLLAFENRIPIAILTKGGKRALQDLDIINKFGEHIKIGATLTFDNPEKSAEWEKGAALPNERLEALKTFKDNSVKTWASFEPVINPVESLKIMEKSLMFVDEYKIGKINNYGGIDKTIDWTAFLEKVVKMLRDNNKPFYVKYDLRQAAPIVKLYGNEVLEDEFCVKPWEKQAELF